MATNKIKWTPEMLDRFHELRARNYTVLEIAENMGLRFEVVQGKVNRERTAEKADKKAVFRLEPEETAPGKTPPPTAEATQAPDMVNHPEHYTFGNIECIDAINTATSALTGFQAYLSGTILKYIWRWSHKGGLEDLKKAEVYLHWLISEVEKNG